MPRDGGVFLQRDRATLWCYCRGTARRDGGVFPQRDRATLRELVLLQRDRATAGDGGVFLRWHRATESTL